MPINQPIFDILRKESNLIEKVGLLNNKKIMKYLGETDLYNEIIDVLLYGKVILDKLNTNDKKLFKKHNYKFPIYIDETDEKKLIVEYEGYIIIINFIENTAKYVNNNRVPKVRSIFNAVPVMNETNFHYNIKTIFEEIKKEINKSTILKNINLNKNEKFSKLDITEKQELLNVIKDIFINDKRLDLTPTLLSKYNDKMRREVYKYPIYNNSESDKFIIFRYKYNIIIINLIFGFYSIIKIVDPLDQKIANSENVSENVSKTGKGKKKSLKKKKKKKKKKSIKKK